jgi:hypothetical protein
MWEIEKRKRKRKDMTWEEGEEADESGLEYWQALKWKWKVEERPETRDGKHTTSHQQALAMCQSVPGVTSAHGWAYLNSHPHQKDQHH